MKACNMLFFCLNILLMSHINNGGNMKKFLLVFLFFIYSNVSATQVYISKKDVESNIFVNDCDFILYDRYGNIIDSWVQNNSYHLLDIPLGIYTLIERPYVLDAFNDDLSVSHKLNVYSDEPFEFNLYNNKIETPRNLVYIFQYKYGLIFILIGLIIIYCCKFSFL